MKESQGEMHTARINDPAQGYLLFTDVHDPLASAGRSSRQLQAKLC
jgi:hypothetical protein